MNYGALGNMVSGSGTAGNVLQDNFFKLLITQMQFQDPTANVENIDFVQQLATISIANQVVNTNAYLDSMVSNRDARAVAGPEGGGWSAYLDKVVVADTGQFVLSDGVAYCGFTLTDPAYKIGMKIFDSTGKVVHSRYVDGRLDPGSYSLKWDGLDDQEDKLMPDGSYRAEFQAYDSRGERIAIRPEVRGRVSSILSPGQGISYLVVDKALLTADQVRSIGTVDPINFLDEGLLGSLSGGGDSGLGNFNNSVGYTARDPSSLESLAGRVKQADIVS